MYEQAITPFAGAPEIDQRRLAFPRYRVSNSHHYHGDLVRRTVDFRDIMAVGSHQPGDGEMEDCANNCTREQKKSSADTINDGKHESSGGKEDHVLDDRRGQSRIAGHSSHLENVDNIVHGHIATKELLPHLHTGAS